MKNAFYSNKIFRTGALLACLTTLLPIGGCASHPPVPVVERGAHVESRAASEAAASQADSAGFYTVKKGDTLLSIGLDHGQSYRDLAAWNNLEDPNKIQVGQQLRVITPETESIAPVAVAKPVNVGTPLESAPAEGATQHAAEPRSKETVAQPVASVDMLKREPKGGKQPYSAEALARLQQPETAPAADARPAAGAAVAEKVAEKPAEKPLPQPSADENVEWAWPAIGKVIGNFVEGSSKGLDIAGKPGEPVLAAAPGKVILVSSALRGYGNFVIIKHNPSYLSVYAHNSRILVKEEQSVGRGEKIAEIGSSDTDRPKLHFEIRRQGKPVDPAKFLPAR
jgi:lipoprotein NlpD